DAVLLAQLAQHLQVDGVVLRERARALELRGEFLGVIRHDLQPPGLGGQPGFDKLLAFELMRLRIATADVLETVRVGQILALIGHETTPHGAWANANFGETPPTPNCGPQTTACKCSRRESRSAGFRRQRRRWLP